MRFVFLFFLIQTAVGKDGAEDETSATQTHYRDKRLFSLFAVVTFPNDECTTVTDSTMKGTCLSSTECTDMGGTADGNCASGFGVCCMHTLYACGGTVSRNCTYIGSPSYPTTYTTAGTCTYTISPVSTDICQIRMDFDYFVSTATGTSGLCGNNNLDKLETTGPTMGTTATNFPPLCGTLTGQHIYVEQGTSTTATSLAFTLGSSTKGFTYKIKISQIECSNLSLPPTDCAQYFTGVSGTFKSYNYPTSMLALADYGTCFRKERGYCSISYGPNENAAGLTVFDLEPSSGTETTACTRAYVAIPNLATTTHVYNAIPGSGGVTGIICGGAGFTTSETNTNEGISGTAVQTSPPFVIQTRTHQSTVATSLGYNLAWTQMPCQ